MRRVKYIFVVLGGMVVSITNIFASENFNFPHFISMLIDTQILHSEDDSCFREYVEISKLEPDVAAFICNFWETRAYLFYREDLEHVLHVFVDIEKSKTAEEKEKKRERFKKQVDLIKVSYFYDHWEEIKEMIHKRLKVAKNNTDRIVGKKVSKPTGFIEKLKLFIGLDSKN